MRPTEFATESIIQAGKDLQAVGRNITGFALRQKVGGGNPTRLKQVWDEHIAGQSEQKAQPTAELPVEVAEEVSSVTKALTDRILALAVELNAKAVKAAELQVHVVARAAKEQREQAERELADASQTIDELETKLDDALARGETQEKKLAEVQALSQAQAVELAQLRERLDAMDAERGRYQAEAERLRADHEDAAKLRGQVEAMQTHAASLMEALANRQA